MEKDKNIIINKLSVPVPEYRHDEIREMLAFHDMPTVLSTILKYIPEENFRHVIRDLKNEQGVVMESMINEREGNGQGALKILVGKSLDGKLTDSECDKIGAIIASMDGVPKGYYVGMVNFLGASCRIYHRIQGSYAEAALKRAKTKSGDHPKGIPPEQVPEVVNRMFPGKTIPTDAELKQRAEQETADVKNRFDDERKEQESKPSTRKFRSKTEEAEYDAGIQAGQEVQEPQETIAKEEQLKLDAAEAEAKAAEAVELAKQQKIEQQKKNKEEMIAKRKHQSQKQAAFKQYVPQLQIPRGMGQFGKTGRK